MAQSQSGTLDWLANGRSGFERPAYILHRITGLGILIYFLMHVVVTSLRAWHLYLWEEPHIFDGPPFKIAEFFVFLAFGYHAFNGIRLLLLDFGVPVGRPQETTDVAQQPPVVRPLVLAIMLLAFLFLMAGGYRMLTASD